jgi:hypothetical protein
MNSGQFIFIYVVSLIVGLLISYAVIRMAVKHGVLGALSAAGLVKDGSPEALRTWTQTTSDE